LWNERGGDFRLSASSEALLGHATGNGLRLLCRFADALRRRPLSIASRLAAQPAIPCPFECFCALSEWFALPRLGPIVSATFVAALVIFRGEFYEFYLVKFRLELRLDIQKQAL
jgi:hypothetical protein